MKLTNVDYNIGHSIYMIISKNCFYKTYDLISYNIRKKINNEIWISNLESIQDMQKRTLTNLKNEIN